MSRLFRISLCALVISLAASWSGVGCGPTPTSEKTAEQSAKDGGIETVVEKAPEKVAEKTSEKVVDAAVEKSPEKIKDSQEPAPDTVAEKIAETPKEAIVETPVEKAPANQLAVVLNSNYVKGSYSVFDSSTKMVTQKDLGPIHGDSTAVVWGGWLLVLNRYLKDDKDDTLEVIDAKTWKVLQTIPLGKKVNPQDVAVLNPNKAYVTLYDDKHMLAVDPTAGKILGKFDLSSLAEKSAKACTEDKECKDNFGNGSAKCDTQAKVCQGDGFPEAGKLLIDNGKLYVLIQGLDRNDGFKPVQSAIAVFDTAKDQLDKTLTLKGTNPVAFVKEPAGTYLINEVGSSFSAEDGGLERFDPKTGTVEGKFVFTEKEAGGSFSFSGIVVVSSSLGYALVNDASYKQGLIQFDPGTGKKLKELMNGKSLSHIALNAAGELYLGDKAAGAAGIRIFEAATAKELTSAPIATSADLPPALILFLPTAP